MHITQKFCFQMISQGWENVSAMFTENSSWENKQNETNKTLQKQKPELNSSVDLAQGVVASRSE